MSPRGLTLLAGVTALCVVLAVWAVVSRDLPTTSTREREPMFSGLLERLNEVEAIRVTDAEGPITLRRADAGWRVEERGGYPADPEQVRKLGLGLAGLQLVEAKTTNPERLSRLELQEPPKEGAKGRVLELIGKDDKPIAAAVVGKTKYGLLGGGRSGVYVRRRGEDQAWLAAGELNLPAEPIDVMRREVVDIPAARIQSVILGVDGPGPLTVRRAASGTPAPFEIDAPVPPGKKADEAKLEQLVGMLSNLTLQDVKPAKDVAFAPGQPRARFLTTDGLQLDAQLATLGEGDGAEHWVTFAPATAATTGAAQPAADPARPAPASPAPADPAAEAAELKGSLEGWAFRLPEYAASRLAWRLDDLLADAGTS